ncbi:MAG: DNA mismatch repair endonuclease MutL [Verrucomicrobia bacterium]|nr:DNA mismatch repair endonuclease MutL [Verrucomicrobiota bacterium]
MSNRIRLLSEQAANQIAAGEVIERPASVIKELVENALDAQAHKITVEIQAGGRSLMRVTDDGTGMNRDDALLCLERHATSKIRSAEDLASISSMGFRGEAMPSIASVSRMTLTTRTHDPENPEGTRIVINGGKIQEVKVAGSPPGTSVEVRQLFFNLPARRKFLRTEETERSHIQHYLSLVAMAYPEVALDFLQEGRLIWQLPAIESGPDPEGRLNALQERLKALRGGGGKMLALDASSSAGPTEPSDSEEPAPPDGIRIWGVIGAPGVSRSSRDEQHLFVNRRPVDHRGLNFALMEGYHTALMKGRYPVCCLFLEINPALVDVNIHPAKREVKFHQEYVVRRAVSEAVRNRLLTFHSNPAGPGAASAPLPDLAVPDRSVDVTPPPPPPEPPTLALPLEGARPGVIRPEPAAAPANPTAPPAPSVAPSPARDTAPHATTVPSRPVPPHAETATPGPIPLLNVPLRLLGVVGKLYVVLESDRGLVLLDQHAAHERVLFEQMLRRLEQSGMPSQKLLLPETIELSARDAQFLREQLETLCRLGVGLSEFGERTFLLDALPPFVLASNPREFVLELVDGLKSAGQSVNTWRLGEQTVAKTVCRHAVKANDALSSLELESLIRDLRQCTMPYTCPHGRPTMIEMGFRELEKKFGRIQ